jgi:hypothetical protein
MATCEININNGVPVAQTYPKLMQELMVYSDFNITQALDLYGLALTIEFQELGIQNPTLQNILSFNEQIFMDTDTPLNKQDRQDILNISLQQEYIEDVKERFINAFNVNGNFGIEVDKLKASGLFTDSDIMELTDVENINKLKDLYYKLNNTDEVITGIKSDIILSNSLFDKMNPDSVLQEIYDNYAGMETEQEVIDKANQVGHSLILDNPQLIPKVLRAVSNKQSLVQYETDEYSDQIIPKQTDNMRVTLEQTFDMTQDMSSFLQQLEFIRELPVESYLTESDLVNRYIYNLENQALLSGIDLNALSDIIQDKTYEEIVDFMDSLYNFIYDVQTKNSESINESMEIFVDSYTTFFDTTPSGKKTTVDKINKTGVFLHLETNRTEEEVFASNGLLKISDNVYQKITDNRSLEELYNTLINNPTLLPPKTFSIKNNGLNNDMLNDELDQFISAKAKQYLSENSNVETVKKIVAYKLLAGIETQISETIPTGVLPLNVNEFLTSFNIRMLSNPKLKELFYFTNRGLEAKRVIGEFTAKEIENELTADQFNDLVTYSKLSGNESLEYFTNYNNIGEEQDMRDYYANNLHMLTPYEGEYYVESGNVVTNSNEDFIRVKNRLYEAVAPSVYAPVSTNSRYNNYNLQKPEYNGSIIPNIKGQESGKIQVKKANVNDNEIEFC